MSDDPLRGADVGETKTVRRTVTLYGVNMEPDVYFGDDRFGEARIVDVEIVEDERDGYCDYIRVTWEGDLTKRLPSRWDYCRQPRTRAERVAVSREKWIGRALKAIGFALPIGLSIGVAAWLTPKVTSSLTINGEPVTSPTPTDLTLVMLAFGGFFMMLIWALKWAPGKVSP